jgi:hypothetical protein
MFQVTNPKTGKTYKYSTARKADAYALAERLGVEVQVVQATYRKTYGKTCICGRPEDTHESYDCYKDYKLQGGW